MDPPLPRKTRKGERACDRPFYASDGPTSANIVAEARSAVRSLDTKRPFTPVDSKRTLFGSNPSKPVEGRPPSAFSLNNYQSEGESSRPPSGRRLTPIENAPQVLPSDVVIPTPPSGGPSVKGRRPMRTFLPGHPERDSFAEKVNQKLRNAVAGQSDTDLRMALSPSPPKRGSPSNTPGGHVELARQNSAGALPAPPAVSTETVTARRVRSGPKERSSPVVNSNVRVKSSPPERVIEQITSVNETRSNTNPPGLAESAKGSERLGSGDKRKKKSHSDGEKTPKDDLVIYYEEQIKPLLAQMEEKFAVKNLKELCQDCLKLWNALEKKGFIGKASGSFSARRRGEILRTVFKFLDLSDPRLLLRLGRLILSMKVTGNNLTNICMVVYRVAKAEKNDQLFLEEDMLRCLVDTIRSCEIASHHDALVYAVGAVKHLSSNNPSAQRELLSLQGIDALAQILDAVSKDALMFSKGNVQLISLLIQVTGALRNLADVIGAREIFVSTGVVRNLAVILEPFSSDFDVVWNVCRALSKLTLYTDCCNELLGSFGWLQSLQRILSDYEKKQELVVRICFILGNMTSKSDKVREVLFFDNSLLDVLLSIMQRYFNSEMEVMKNGSPVEKEQLNGDHRGSSKNEDVLIKAIRVIANLSINPEAGSGIAANEQVVDLLIQILEVKDANNSEELVLNTVATLNNLSFYNDTESVIHQRQLEITEMLLSLLMPENMDAMVEASRVFGNFSRSKDVRSLLVQHKVDEIMIALLDAGERETVFTACGVLINLMIDEEVKPKLREEGGIKKLVDVLRDFGKHDWQLSSMVCQILWNYSDKITNSATTFGEEEAIDLMDILTHYLDEDVALDRSELDSADSSISVMLRDMWEGQFVPVGKHLLQRVKSHYTHLVPLESPS